MDEHYYQPEPIPRRPKSARQPLSSGVFSPDAHSVSHTHGKRPATPLPRTPMNGSKPDAREAIARIMADERFRDAMWSTPKGASETAGRQDGQTADAGETLGKPHDSHHANASAGKTPADNGHIASSQQPEDAQPAARNLFSLANAQPAFDLPHRYHEMRAISRWQEGAEGKPGRWLTEAELFYRQGTFMADYEDDCPYAGIFKSYFPTYNAMSDRQLRGYFTWRAAVRDGDIQETSLSFAYVYLYELINGIGVADALDGFRKIEAFWQAYRAFAPELDRYASIWLQDYAVYHGLDPHLLGQYKAVAFDRALIALRQADRAFAGQSASGNGRRKRNEPTIPLPPNVQREDRLFHAIDALSTYRLSNSRMYKESPEALRHVTCAVYTRMSEHHRKQRKNSLLESWFGEEVSLPYTMFGSAVFFEKQRHTDTEYVLDEIHRYRCEHGFWTCERFHGSRSRSPKLGTAMRAVDRSLRETYGSSAPLKDDGKTPKYLQKFIDQEIEAWRNWSAAHAPVHIDIDLSQLAGIRNAAAETREALLIDEEREGGEALETAGDKQVPVADGLFLDSSEPIFATDGPIPAAEEALPAPKTYSDPLISTGPQIECAFGPKNEAKMTEKWAEMHTLLEGSEKTDPEGHTTALLTPSQATYLRALLTDEGPEAIRAATKAAGTSEDLLVDAINEALFDTIGDTVIEYGPDGKPQLIDDYREDVEGILNHE